MNQRLVEIKSIYHPVTVSFVMFVENSVNNMKNEIEDKKVSNSCCLIHYEFHLFYIYFGWCFQQPIHETSVIRCNIVFNWILLQWIDSSSWYWRNCRNEIASHTLPTYSLFIFNIHAESFKYQIWIFRMMCVINLITHNCGKFKQWHQPFNATKRGWTCFKNPGW